MSITENKLNGIKDYFSAVLQGKIIELNQNITDGIFLDDIKEITIESFNPLNVKNGYPAISISTDGGIDSIRDGNRNVIIELALKNQNPTALEKLQYRYTDMIIDIIQKSNRFNRLIESVGDIQSTLYGAALDNKSLNMAIIKFSITYNNK